MMWSTEEMDSYEQTLLETARKEFEEDGQARLISFVFACRELHTGKPQQGVVIVPAMDGPEVHSATVRSVAAATEAAGSITVGEVWTVKGMSDEERRRWGNRPLEEHPDRVEALMAMVERYDTRRFHHAIITRDAEGKPTLGPWEARTPQRSAGRLANIVDLAD